MHSLRDLTYATLIAGTGVLGAFVFTSYFMARKNYLEAAHVLLKESNIELRKKVNNYKRKEEQENANRQPPYTDRYNINDALHNEKHVDLKEMYMFETTPDGIVIIMYDIDEKKFLYWSDETIRFAYLETVARKFVTENQCRDFYVTKPSEKNDNAETETEAETEAEAETTSESTDEQDSVFIKTATDKAKEKIEKAKDNGLTNTYVHKGKLKDFYGLQKTFLEGKTVSFADFKAINNVSL